MEKKKIKEHIESRTITEYLHTPEHDEREDTLEFRSAKRELENVEHLGCFSCKAQGIDNFEKRQSHHIIERSWGNKASMKKVAWLLYNFRDYHGHCHRDFAKWEDLADYLESFKDKGKALDTLYNQLIECQQHHVGKGTGIHYETAPTFDASLVMEDGFHNSLTPEEYEAMKQQLLEAHIEKHAG